MQRKEKEFEQIKRHQKKLLHKQILNSLVQKKETANTNKLLDSDDEGTASSSEAESKSQASLVATMLLEQETKNKEALKKRIKGPALGQYAMDGCFLTYKQNKFFESKAVLESR